MYILIESLFIDKIYCHDQYLACARLSVIKLLSVIYRGRLRDNVYQFYTWNNTMHSKVLILLLSIFVLIDIGTANKIMSVLCSLAKENYMYLPIGPRKCITGCFGDSTENPVVILNECEPLREEPGAAKPAFYDGISF